MEILLRSAQGVMMKMMGESVGHVFLHPLRLTNVTYSDIQMHQMVPILSYLEGNYIHLASLCHSLGYLCRCHPLFSPTGSPGAAEVDRSSFFIYRIISKCLLHDNHQSLYRGMK